MFKYLLWFIIIMVIIALIIIHFLHHDQLRKSSNIQRSARMWIEWPTLRQTSVMNLNKNNRSSFDNVSCYYHAISALALFNRNNNSVKYLHIQFHLLDGFKYLHCHIYLMILKMVIFSLTWNYMNKVIVKTFLCCQFNLK